MSTMSTLTEPGVATFSGQGACFHAGGKKRQGLVSSVPKTSGAQSEKAKQPLRHRTPEPKGREGKEPQKSWK